MHELECKNRKWLWHGTHPETVSKILANGYLKEFEMPELVAKKGGGAQLNACGVGIHFARDAHYSFAEQYAKTFDIGNGVFEKVLLNRVTLGDWC
jgi:hypothetical protein|eukprot:4279273-Prymnesium_polylepis.2